MSESIKDDLNSKPSASSKESLRESLDELAANVDSLVDGLLGGGPADAAPATAAALTAAAASKPEAKPEVETEPEPKPETKQDQVPQVATPAAVPETPAAEPVVPWVAKQQSAPPQAGRRSYRWVAAPGIVLALALIAAWIFGPDRTPPSATVAEELNAPAAVTESPAIVQQAQIVPVAEALSPRDLSGLPVLADTASDDGATTPAKPAPEPATGTVAATPPKPEPKKIEPVKKSTRVKTPPKQIAETTKAEPPKPEPKKAAPVETKKTVAVAKPENPPVQPEPEPSLPKNVAVARATPKTTPPPPEPESKSEPEPVTVVAKAEPQPRPEPPVETPAPAPAVVTAPAGTTGPEPAPVPVSEPPRLLSREEPLYSDRARKRGESGIVELRVLVNAQGRVVRVVVEQGIKGSELEARAIDAALRSSYAPAMEDGEPSEAWVTERFVFQP